MTIVEKAYNWAYTPTKRTVDPDQIVLHHAAAITCSADDIHRWHLTNGWAGIGYQFLVRKDGSVYRGRPIDAVGAHTYGENSDSIGICFEGNFEVETMPEAQKKSGAELVTYVKGLYPSIKEVSKHKDHNATACPGKNFPFDEIAAGAAVPDQSEEPAAANDLYRVYNEIILSDPEEMRHTGNGVFTIIEKKTVEGVVYGKLKSGAGWVSLANAKAL